MTRLNSSVHDACGWVARLAYLNVLWLAASVAGGIILGAFPATVAMYGVMRRWLADPESREESTSRAFLSELRPEIARANAIGYGVLAVGALLALDVTIARAQSGIAGRVLFALSVAAVAMFAVTVVHLPYVYVRIKGPAVTVLRSSWWYALSHPLSTVLIIAVAVVLSFVMGRYPALSLFFGASAVCGLTVFVDERGFASARRGNRPEARRARATV